MKYSSLKSFATACVFAANSFVASVASGSSLCARLAMRQKTTSETFRTDLKAAKEHVDQMTMGPDWISVPTHSDFRTPIDNGSVLVGKEVAGVQFDVMSEQLTLFRGRVKSATAEIQGPMTNQILEIETGGTTIRVESLMVPILKFQAVRLPMVKDGKVANEIWETPSEKEFRSLKDQATSTLSKGFAAEASWRRVNERPQSEFNACSDPEALVGQDLAGLSVDYQRGQLVSFSGKVLEVSGYQKSGDLYVGLNVKLQLADGSVKTMDVSLAEQLHSKKN